MTRIEKFTQVGCVLISILACSLVACRSTGNVSQQRSVEQSTTEADDKLLEVVKQFGDESKAQDAWQKLSSYPRPELNERLLRIFRSLSENDYRRVLIAFVLCNLNYDYETNREIVRSSLSQRPGYEHFYGDWPAALINRLIERGDIDLISQLFASANWADGAASTDLSGYFTKDFRKYPRDFLLRLGKEPYAIRNKVYYLFIHDEMLSKEDLRQIREQLFSLNKESDLSQVANEMLKATSTFVPNG